MIVSVSRRTDIPAFYPAWFLNRLAAGFALVPNPLNNRHVRRISLQPADVDCLVFWTKNPAPLLPDLARLQEYAFYFQFTLTPYGPDLEPNLPAKPAVIDTFRRLSEQVGPDRVIWRYDPILISDRYSLAWHESAFAEYGRILHPYTGKCIISFYDAYRKINRRLTGLGVRPLNQDEMTSLAESLAGTARPLRLGLETCAEAIDLQAFGIGHAHCIDTGLVGKITGRPPSAARDPNQRPACGCAASVDIGIYNTCPHGCRYCYANSSEQRARANFLAHDPASPRLCGKDTVT